MALPELPPIAVLSSYVTRIMGFNPSSFCLQGTNTYLVGAPGQQERILIDTGIGKPEWLKSLQAYLQVTGLKLAAVLITHWHKDHVGGVEQLRQQFPDLKMLKYRCDARDLPNTYTYLEANEVVELAGVRLQVVFTPGHSEDHLCFWLEQENALFSGDTVLGHGTTIFIDYKAYIDSLHLILQTLPKLVRIYPGHGQLVVDGPNKVREYITHRLDREQSVLNALKDQGDGAMDTQGVVRKVYSHISDPKVLEAAARNVDQILTKLELDGAVTTGAHPDTWIIVQGSGRL